MYCASIVSQPWPQHVQLWVNFNVKWFHPPEITSLLTLAFQWVCSMLITSIIAVDKKYWAPEYWFLWPGSNINAIESISMSKCIDWSLWRLILNEMRWHYHVFHEVGLVTGSVVYITPYIYIYTFNTVFYIACYINNINHTLSMFSAIVQIGQ